MCPAGFCFLSFMFTIKAVHSRTRGPYGGDTARTKHFHQTSPFFSLYFPPPPHCCHQPPSFLCYSSSRLLRLVSFSKSSFVLCTSFFSCFCSLTKCCSRLTAETEAAWRSPQIARVSSYLFDFIMADRKSDSAQSKFKLFVFCASENKYIWTTNCS